MVSDENGLDFSMYLIAMKEELPIVHAFVCRYAFVRTIFQLLL